MSGGFAGLENQPVADIDTNQLDADKASEIHQCIDRMLNENEPALGSDMMRYTIDIDEGEGSHRILDVFDEADPNSDIQKLLLMLQ